jgi:thiol-disulfide isomerase/thioredoxin
MKKELLILLFVAVLLSACTTEEAPVRDAPQDVVVVQPPEEPVAPEPVLTREDIMKNAAEAAGYIGTPLAGDTTFYMSFNVVDYEKALADDKLILINFYSTECSYCQDDNAAAIAAFDEMDYEDVIGFRSLFNDPESTLDDKNIAYDYSVESPNTKVIIKGGKRVFKGTDSWTKDDFIEEIARNRG